MHGLCLQPLNIGEFLYTLIIVKTDNIIQILY